MSDTEHATLRAEIDAAVDAVGPTLLNVAHAIHERPELAFEEHFACQTLTKALRDHALPVETGVYSLETAFETTINPDHSGPTVAVLAE